MEDLRDPAYPAGHPMNARFDQLESNIEESKNIDLPIIDDSDRPSSPLGLSSSSSSFTTNLIA